MAYYYKTGISDVMNEYVDNGLQLYKVKRKTSRKSSINFDFSKHVLIELLDDVTPENKLWKELGLTRNKSIVHKRMMVDAHRRKCRRAIVICINADEAKKTAERLSQTKIMTRSICAVVVEELLSDLQLFEKQIENFGDQRPQHQLLYVTDLNEARKPADLVQFLTDKFSPFGTIFSVLISMDSNDIAHSEGVIKFAYLSEAFAAEIALDQYIVGKERLTVTMHHNIILSQCDLRLRLREAHWNQRNNSNSSFINVNFPDLISEPTIRSSVSFKNPGENVEILTDNGKSVSLQTSDRDLVPDIKENLGNISHNVLISSEINEILESPCYSNLLSRFKSIKVCNDKIILSNLNTNDASAFKDEDSNVNGCYTTKSSINNFPSETVSLAWPAKVLNWIANISENSSTHIESSEDTILKKNKETSKDELSTTGSYATCGNNEHDLSSGSLEHLLEKTAINDSKSSDKDTHSTSYLSSSEKFCDEPENDENCPLATKLGSSIKTPSNLKNCSKLTASQKKKIFKLSEKLSLKKQRMRSSQLLTKNTDIRIQSSPTDVLLREKDPLHCILNLDGNCRRSSILNQTTVVLSNSKGVLCSNSSDSSQLATQCSANDESCANHCSKDNSNILKNSQNNTSDLPAETQSHSKRNFKKKSRAQKHSIRDLCDNDQLDSESYRKSLRLASRFTRFKEFEGSSVNTESCENQCVADKVNCANDLETCVAGKSSKSITPLQSWLKRELIFSTNNKISPSKLNSKRIICATMQKNNIISVGCSHMTCDLCYPESVNLLFGYP